MTAAASVRTGRALVPRRRLCGIRFLADRHRRCSLLGADGAGEYNVALTFVLTLTAVSGSGVATGFAYYASRREWAPPMPSGKCSSPPLSSA